MQTAHDLARYAALAADYICVDDVESFSIERSFDPDVSRVTFYFFGGRRRTYIVTMEKEADAPDGESGPSSP